MDILPSGSATNVRVARQISIRGPVLPAMLLNRTLNEPYFKTDPRHIAQPLHTYLGDLVVAFLQDTMCKKDEILAAAAEQQNQWSTETSKWLGSVPRVRSLASFLCPEATPELTHSRP